MPFSGSRSAARRVLVAVLGLLLVTSFAVLVQRPVGASTLPTGFRTRSCSAG
jgi:hypothetical protein